MKYIYKNERKFPHVILIDSSIPIGRVYELNDWLKENIGEYNKHWSCPPMIVNDDGDCLYWQYGFKTGSDALAFKLGAS